MKIFSKLLALVAASTAVLVKAQDTDSVQQVPSTMTLTQFQTVLRTFLDDEMAVVMDMLAPEGHEFSLTDDGVPVTATDDDTKRTVEHLNPGELESSLETMLVERISIIETDSDGSWRRILKNHHHRHRDRKEGKEKLLPPHQRGRFVDIEPASIPRKVNATWDGIIAHAWDMAKVVSTSSDESTSSSPNMGSKTRGRGSEKDTRNRAFDADSDIADTAVIEEDDELVTNWSDEAETLFLVCHSTLQALDGNGHLKQILTAAGKDVNMLDAPQDNIEVVHSSPLLTCVILSMQPTYALNIAERGSTNGDSTLTLVPWIDVMKISPDIFDQILNVNEGIIADESSGGGVRQRGLRNFRRTQSNITEVAAAADDSAESLFWDTDLSSDDTMENKYIVFSLVSPSTIEDAQGVIQSLLVMANIGRRRRMSSGEQSTADAISISDVFSITRAAFNAGNDLSASARHWSRILESGIESESECSKMVEAVNLQTSLVSSSYEFLLNSEGLSMSLTAYTACVASVIAGLAVNPNVINVGIVPRNVELHNDKAQWVLQGSVIKNSAWRRPFFEAGLNGNGQIVSVSDTGVDTKNCYFKDENGDGDIFSNWDISRRKVVKYDVSSRGGDKTDAYKGHGSHVAGTISGRHIHDESMGDGDDHKEGMAPAAKIHVYDIGIGSAVNDPREGWMQSFYQDGPNNGAKIGSGSWGFGYRTSYDWVCRLYDKLLVDHPDVLHVSSAGNTGNKFDSPYKTVGAPASCKNVFAVGATNNADFGISTTYAVDFSSRGPTGDGRTKPDVMAPGYALDSAGSGFTDCAAEEPVYLKAGTSMATPVVAGASALVRQYFQEGYYPCGSKGCSDSINPSGALIKAVLANGAQPVVGVQIGGTKTILNNQNTSPYDNTQNMGTSNLLKSLPLDNENHFSIFVQNDMPILSGDTLTFDFTMNPNDCASDFSATLAWYDPPASNGCTKCLVNDLDLLVENISSSEKYYPNGLSKADTLNNIERVRVKSTANKDKYRVSVVANMLGPGYNKQNFALVVTGCFEQGASSNTQQPDTITQSYDLALTYTANRKQAGNMFAIKAKTDGVQVTSFAIHTTLSDKTVKMHVYKLNTYGGISTGNESFLTNPDAWTRISPSSGIEVEAKGFGAHTIIPVGSFKPVAIPNEMVQTFYITFVDETEMLYKATNTDYPTGSEFSSDDAISIFSGVGKGLDFGSNWLHRQMNGAVYYSITSNETNRAGSMPTGRPTKVPTGRPTKNQRNKNKKNKTGR